MQALFDKVKGVVSTVAGYTGGHKKNPTYEEVCSGKTGHFEAIEILYDPSRVTYKQLLYMTTYIIAHKIRLSKHLSCRLVRHPSGKKDSRQAGMTQYAQKLMTLCIDICWKNIEPTMLNRQFVDFGTQYRTTIFYHDEEQKRLAEASKERLEKSGKFYKPIVTEIQPASTFYKAEEYHQQYYKKNPIRYEFYEAHSGRSQYLKTIWSSEAKK